MKCPLNLSGRAFLKLQRIDDKEMVLIQIRMAIATVLVDSHTALHLFAVIADFVSDMFGGKSI